MNELPRGWSNSSFIDIFDIQGGTQPPKKEFIYNAKKGYIRLLQIRDFGEHQIPTFIPYKPNLKICNKDDILIGRYGASVGKICSGKEGAYNVALTKVIIPDYINRRFVYFLLKSNLFQQPILNIERSAQDGFNKKDMSDIIINIPPFNEQHRIVSKLEKILPKIESCKERLAKIPLILKRFRQSVLAAACSGRLTADWRGKNPCLETEKEFLTRKEDKLRHLPEFQSFVPEWLNNIPLTWRPITFMEIIAEGPQNGLYKPQSYYGDGILIVRIDNFYDGKIHPWNTLKRISLTPEEQNLYSLNNKDVLINRVNSMKFLGKSALVRHLSEPCVFESNVMRIQIREDIINPEYIINYLQSIQGRTEIIKNAKHAVNQSSINQQDVKNVIIALPPLDEQHEIVCRIEALFKKADEIEERYKKIKGYIDKLTQSVLAKAFSGELVPQNPEDEPALVLLEKIKQQKTTNSKKKKAI